MDSPIIPIDYKNNLTKETKTFHLNFFSKARNKLEIILIKISFNHSPTGSNFHDH